MDYSRTSFFFWLKKQKQRVGILGIGLLGKRGISSAFDYVLYPYVIWKFGILEGGVIMAMLSFFACYLLILFYDWSQQDWLGIEAIKEAREYSGDAFIGRIISWMMKRGDGLMFLALTFYFDPLITTLYLRRGSRYFNGLNMKDWLVFISSTIIANAYWTAAVFFGISVVEYIWNLVVG